jgi:hypothetical protein
MMRPDPPVGGALGPANVETDDVVMEIRRIALFWASAIKAERPSGVRLTEYGLEK